MEIFKVLVKFLCASNYPLVANLLLHHDIYILSHHFTLPRIMAWDWSYRAVLQILVAKFVTHRQFIWTSLYGLGMVSNDKFPGSGKFCSEKSLENFYYLIRLMLRYLSKISGFTLISNFTNYLHYFYHRLARLYVNVILLINFRYISTEFIFYFLSPIFLLTLGQNKKRGYLLSIFCIALSDAGRIFVMIVHNMPPTQLGWNRPPIYNSNFMEVCFITYF